MNAQSTPTNSKNIAPPPKQVGGPEIGPALKRDRLLQRVRAARKRLTPVSDGLPKLR